VLLLLLLQGHVAWWLARQSACLCLLLLLPLLWLVCVPVPRVPHRLAAPLLLLHWHLE
jgi:hypothetical protein